MLHAVNSVSGGVAALQKDALCCEWRLRGKIILRITVKLKKKRELKKGGGTYINDI